MTLNSRWEPRPTGILILAQRDPDQRTLIYVVTKFLIYRIHEIINGYFQVTKLVVICYTSIKYLCISLLAPAKSCFQNGITQLLSPCAYSLLLLFLKLHNFQRFGTVFEFIFCCFFIYSVLDVYNLIQYVFSLSLFFLCVPMRRKSRTRMLFILFREVKSDVYANQGWTPSCPISCALQPSITHAHMLLLPHSCLWPQEHPRTLFFLALEVLLSYLQYL